MKVQEILIKTLSTLNIDEFGYSFFRDAAIRNGLNENNEIFQKEAKLTFKKPIQIMQKYIVEFLDENCKRETEMFHYWQIKNRKSWREKL